MGLNGLEPSTSRLSGVRSNQLSYRPILKAGDENRTRDNSLEGCGFTTKLHPQNKYWIFNGAGQNRTADTWSFNPLLYRLSYRAITVLTRLELVISCVTGRRPNQLDHRTIIAGAGFEPTTFGLWARRATRLLHPAIIKKEDERFELSRGLTHLTVFKTVPFSQTWVILHNTNIRFTALTNKNARWTL